MSKPADTSPPPKDLPKVSSPKDEAKPAESSAKDTSNDRVKPSEKLSTEAKESSTAVPDEELKTEDILNQDIFNQLIDLDEEGEYDFSKGMVEAYFTQADDTFGKMDAALKADDLKELSSLGHFLKGSSAILGVKQVESSCEKIEHFGKLRDHKANKDLEPPEALKLIAPMLTQAKAHHVVAVRWLKKWYGDKGVRFDET